MKSLTLSGTVTSSGTPVKNARVLLAAPAALLDKVAGARAYPADGFAWTRPLTGFDKNTFRCYLYTISGHVAGAKWGDALRDAIVAHNPVLAPGQDNFQLRPGNSYTIPEPTPAAGFTPVMWQAKTQPTTITLWRAWLQNIREASVGGIVQETFYAAARAANPTLQNNELRAGESYLLPVKSTGALLYLASFTDGNGAFRFDGLPAGGYSFIVAGVEMEPYRDYLYLRESHPLAVTLKPRAEAPAPPPAFTLSDSPNFVRVQGSHFVVGGARLSPFVGVNLRGLAHYGDQQLLAASKSEDERNVQLKAAGEMGAKVVRLFLANKHRSDDEILTRLRKTLDLVGQRGMHAIIAFTDFHKDSGFTLIDDDNKYKDGLPNTPETLDRAFYEAVEQMHYFRFVKKIVSEFKNDTRIFAWELGNELKPWSKPNGQVQRHPDVFHNFAKKVSELIRSLDQNHLIGTGIVSAGNLGFDSAGARKLYDLGTLDFQSFHLYYRSNGQKHADNVTELGFDFGAGITKPILVGEIGVEVEGVGQDRSGHLDSALREWFKDRGAAGVLQWGFMATEQNNHDGDDFRGMMLNKHSDYNALFQTYQRWATQELPNIS